MRDKKLLSEMAYEKLRHGIVRCDLSPGSEWTEQQLRERYGFSIATSRVALAKLVQDGLLLALPRRGYQVPPITLRDVTEIFDLRAIVEPGVARLAAQLATRAQIEVLREMISQKRKSDLKTQDEFIRTNRELHIAIASVCANVRCTRIVSRLLDDAERVLHAGVISVEQNKEFLDAHERIIELMVERDLVALETHVREHIVTAKAVVMDAVYSNGKVLDVNLA